MAMRLILGIVSRINLIFYSVKRLIINLKPSIHIGKGSIIENGAVISTRYGGTITIGENCHIGKYGQVLSCGGDIIIGNYSTINSFAMVYGQGGLKIGNGVRIATQAAILPSNHVFVRTDIMIYEQGLSKKGIIIEDDVWIGAGVKVLDGCVIKKGCIIGANAVVSKSTEKYGIYVGVPARMIKKRL